MNVWPHLPPPSLGSGWPARGPAASEAAHAPHAWAALTATDAPLLRAEVPPQAQGLSAQAHAQRVLAHLVSADPTAQT